MLKNVRYCFSVYTHIIQHSFKFSWYSLSIYCNNVPRLCSYLTLIGHMPHKVLILLLQWHG